MPDSQRRRRSGTATREERSWYWWLGVLLENEQPLGHAAYRHHSALEERIVAPRPLEPLLRGTHGMRIVELDLLGVEAIGDVVHRHSVVVVLLVFLVAYQ